MQSFLAMFWDPGDVQGVQTARALRRNLPPRGEDDAFSQEEDGFLLADLSRPAGPRNLLPLTSTAPGTFGVVFGTLFPHSAVLAPAGPVSRLAPDVAAACFETGGETLSRYFWGPNVSLIGQRGSLRVRPDPAGAIPCYFFRSGGVTFIFSNLEKVPLTDYSAFSVDWDFVSRLLAYDKILNGRTGITGIRELLPGEVLTCTWDRDPVAETFHDPRAAAGDTLALSDEDAADLLSQTVRYVVRSQASRFKDIAVSLSGGLDSSIILACLAGSGFTGRLAGVHYVLGSGDGRELDYAASVARHTGSELVRVDVPPEYGFPDPVAFPATPRPFRQFTAPDLAALSPPTLPGNAAWMTGQGGDHLFLAATGPLGFADYLARRGWDGDAAQVLLDTARLSGLSIWSVLREAVLRRQARMSAMAEGMRARATSLNQHQQASLAPSDGLPAWATAPGRLPPAKFNQVSTLPHLFQLRECLDSAGARLPVHPLISQPLIELCLRLPAWQLCTGGVSRGLVRKAFGGALPDEVLQRISKGFASRYYAGRIAARRALILETLLDGELVRRGLISRPDLEAFARRDQFQWEKSGAMLMVYYGIEAWLQAWRRLGAQGFSSGAG